MTMQWPSLSFRDKSHNKSKKKQERKEELKMDGECLDVYTYMLNMSLIMLIDLIVTDQGFIENGNSSFWYFINFFQVIEENFTLFLLHPLVY